MIYVPCDFYDCAVYKPIQINSIKGDIVNVINQNIKKGVQYFINVSRIDDLEKLYEIKRSDITLANELARGICEQYKDDAVKFVKELNEIHERLR